MTPIERLALTNQSAIMAALMSLIANQHPQRPLDTHAKERLQRLYDQRRATDAALAAEQEPAI